MAERRVLVIGSQCDQLKPRLSFLPGLAEALYAVMADPERGQCVPALLDGSGLLLDPSVMKARSAIKEAFESASRDEATLFIAYIGHGMFADDDFYLLPRNASVPPDSDTGVHLVQLIKELHGRHSAVDGLVVLLDTCYSGVAAAMAPRRWGKLGWPLRFEMLTATADLPAADGCFTRHIVDALRMGLREESSEYIRCEHLRAIVTKNCGHQESQHPTLNADKGLYLARNAARYVHIAESPWARTNVADEIDRLTAWYQPVPQLEEVVTAAQAARSVLVVGDAGTGKSALSAALARPVVTENKVPPRFVQAVYFISERTTPWEFAESMAVQLNSSHPEFREAHEIFKKSMPLVEYDKLQAIDRKLLGPLRCLQSGKPVRLVIDGLDRLSTSAQLSVQSALDSLTTEAALSHVRLVLTNRPDMLTGSTGTPIIKIGITSNEQIAAYLERRGVGSGQQTEIVARARGNWLVAQTLADLALVDPTFRPETLPPGLAGAYKKRILEAGAADMNRWRTQLRPVLSVLAAAGVGPILPMPLLCAASGKLGGPDRVTRVRDVLFDLRGVVVRGAPGTPAERAGVFHQTFCEYVLNSIHDFGIDPQEPHTALAEVIAEVAPMDKHDPNDPLHSYGMQREAEHLWMIRRYEQAVDSLSKRRSMIPEENLRRYQNWSARVYEILGPHHPGTLIMRYNIARCTGETGNADGALQLFKELLPDLKCVFGPNHPSTLYARHHIARWTEASGKVRKAYRLFRTLLRDVHRELGPNDITTLAVRGNLLRLSHEQTENESKNVRQYQSLLRAQLRVLGPNNPDTMVTRYNILVSTAKIDQNPEKALQIFKKFLPDAEQVWGANDPHTFSLRSAIAGLTGAAGNNERALHLFEELLSDMTPVLGYNHPYTLATRGNIIMWTLYTAQIDKREALQVLKQLLPEFERVLGPSHRQTRILMGNIAEISGSISDVQDSSVSATLPWP